MPESLAKLAQVLQDAMEDGGRELARMVENGQGLEALYELRSKVSDCIAAIELKAAR